MNRGIEEGGVVVPWCYPVEGGGKGIVVRGIACLESRDERMS